MTRRHCPLVVIERHFSGGWRYTRLENGHVTDAVLSEKPLDAFDVEWLRAAPESIVPQTAPQAAEVV